jgi:hypothetical protein
LQDTSYAREIFQTKAPATRCDNEKELANLLKVFAHMPIDAIAPMHIREYMDTRLGIEITGELADVIARINERPRRAISAFLIQEENGQALTQGALRSRFDKARTLAKVDFQFRDIRGKAATDTGNLAHSQKLLGHKNRDMTEHYVKARIGERVKPLR